MDSFERLPLCAAPETFTPAYPKKKMKRKLLCAAAAALTLGACSGLKDAFSAHTGVVARAGSVELSATQLGEFMAHSRAPAARDVASTIANLWIDYHLLAQAAANNDSLADVKDIDAAMWPMIANLKARKWYEIVSKSWGTEDPAAAEADYAAGRTMSAQHILLLTPQGMSDTAKARIKKKAEALRAKVTSANFAAMAAANSEDPGSSKRGGSLGIFARGQMVPAFENALRALKPGEISGVVTTQYGYHIIRRPTYDEIKTDALSQSKGASVQKAESTYLARVEAAGDVSIKSNAVSTMHAIGSDPDSYATDNTVLATSKAGKFTAARLVGWAQTFPPQAQVFSQMRSAPDSVLNSFLRNLVKNELVLRQADSAKIQPDPIQLAQMRVSFSQSVQAALNQLAITPAMLADSAKTTDAKLTLANRRVDEYFNKLVLDLVPFVQLPTPVITVLRTKYSYTLNAAGLDRAVEVATKLRLTTPAGAPTGSPTQGPPPETAVPLAPTASSTAPSTSGGH
jgi:peptidyl-prolyl cis-trans isomerase D